MGSLVFLISCIGALIALIILFYRLFTKQYHSAWNTARLLSFGLCGYLGVLLFVSFTSPQRMLSIGQEQCFDDICVSVLQVARTPAHEYVVTVQIRNAGRGRAQRPDHLAIQIVDRQGRDAMFMSVDATTGATTSADSTRINALWNQPLLAGQQVSHQISFDWPTDAEQPLLLATEGGWPTVLVIGDENSFFHPHTVFRLAEP